MSESEQFVYKADKVMAGRNTTDGSGQDEVEHQGRDGKLCHPAAHGFLHNAIDASAHKHAAAFHIERAHCVRQKHDAEDEPRRGLAKSLLSYGTCIESGRAHVVEHDGSSAPEGDKAEHSRSGYDYFGGGMS